MTQLLACLFIIACHFAVFWAAIVYGLGIEPRSWAVLAGCVLSSAVLKTMAQHALKENRA